jgi:hypothetical protein
MHIDKFKKRDGYYDDEGCFYENAIDFMQVGVFGFCGCGSPKDNLIYIRDSMRLLRDFCFAEHDEKAEKYDAFYNRYRAAVDAHFVSRGAEEFMWYWLSKCSYTIHGSSVPGFLSKLGEKILEDLEEITKDV